MHKLIPYVIIAWLFSLLIVGGYSYNKGVTMANAKINNAVSKQIESNITTNNYNLALVESLNEYNLKNWQRLLYPNQPLVVTKIIKESAVCDKGVISNNVINMINGVIR